MSKIAVIALNTFKENLRDKILYNLVFFGLLLIGSSLLLSTLTIGERSKIIADLGLASVNLFGVLIAIFVGISLVNKEIERRTIYTIVAKPVSRYEFLIGKYAGLMLTLLVNMSIMAIGFMLTMLLGAGGFDLALLKALGLIFVELLVITAVAVLFSTFTSPTLSAIFTLSVYVIGHLTADLKLLGVKSVNVLSKVVLDGLYYALPNLEYFNIKGQVVHRMPIESWYVLTALGYGLCYTAAILVLACVVFQRRDFK
jgi:ABC-type transport system involved in multi-copper enzyme maturation permease subunit